MAYMLCKSRQQNWYPGHVMRELVPVTASVMSFGPGWTQSPLGIPVAVNMRVYFSVTVASTSVSLPLKSNIVPSLLLGGRAKIMTLKCFPILQYFDLAIN